MINSLAASQAIDYLSTGIVRTIINFGFNAQRHDLLPLVESRYSLHEYSDALPRSTETELHAQYDRLTYRLKLAAVSSISCGSSTTIAGMCLVALEHKIYVNRSLMTPEGELRFLGELETSPFGFYAIGAGAALIVLGVCILTQTFNQALNQRARQRLMRNYEV